MITTGYHLILDIYGVPFEKANDLNLWLSICQDAAVRAKTTILDISKQQFQPQGCSGIILISESHISFHTFPEKQFVALDFYTCGSRDNFLIGKDFLIRKIVEIDPDNIVIRITELERGKNTPVLQKEIRPQKNQSL